MKTLNGRAYRIFERLGLRENTAESDGMFVVDVGVEREPDNPLDVGLAVAEASMGGLGSARVSEGVLYVGVPKKPAVATLGCQLAGWKIGVGCYVSGPARVLSGKPKEFYGKAGYVEQSDKAAAVIECDSIPSLKTLEEIKGACGSSKLACACFKPNSKVGVLNVLSRVVEMAFFRLDYLGYDTKKIVSAEGSVPCEGVVSSEDANDAIVYGGRVSLEARGWDDSLTPKCVSSASRLHGRRFADVLAEAGGDFFNVDFDFYAPAELTVKDLVSDGIYTAGGVYSKPT